MKVAKFYAINWYKDFTKTRFYRTSEVLSKLDKVIGNADSGFPSRKNILL